jgi:hypothetical protein
MAIKVCGFFLKVSSYQPESLMQTLWVGGGWEGVTNQYFECFLGDLPLRFELEYVL